jgi:hypothetical protein
VGVLAGCDHRVDLSRALHRPAGDLLAGDRPAGYGALAFELAGLFFLLRYFRGGGLALVLVCLLCLYGAWAFKLYGGIILASLAVIVKVGVLNYALRHDLLASMSGPYPELRQKLEALPGPTFVSDATRDLPWIQRKPPFFLTASNYRLDPSMKYAQGGWEGLMSRHYFNTVAIACAIPLPAELLDGYVPFSQDADFIYYRPKP